MVKLIHTAAVVAFFLLFAFSHALTSDVIDSTSDEKLPSTEAVEVKEDVNTLRLPSERSQVQIGTSELNEEEKSTTETVPLTFVNFRPDGGRPFPLGHRRGCRHGKRGPRFHRGNEIEKDGAHKTVAFGNDMILSNGDEMKFDRHFHGGERQIPARWTGFRHVGPRFAHKHDDEEHHEMESERPHRRHRHHDHDGEEEEKHHGHGLSRTIRKFLNGF